MSPRPLIRNDLCLPRYIQQPPFQPSPLHLAHFKPAIRFSLPDASSLLQPVRDHKLSWAQTGRASSFTPSELSWRTLLTLFLHNQRHVTLEGHQMCSYSRSGAAGGGKCPQGCTLLNPPAWPGPEALAPLSFCAGLFVQLKSPFRNPNQYFLLPSP